MNWNDENGKKMKNIKQILKALKFKIRNDPKKIKQKIYHKHNNQVITHAEIRSK